MPKELKTDRNKTGYIIKQRVDDRNPRSNEIILSHDGSKDFQRITFGNPHGLSPCWFTIQMEKIKNNRHYAQSAQIDRAQLRRLIDFMETEYQLLID